MQTKHLCVLYCMGNRVDDLNMFKPSSDLDNESFGGLEDISRLVVK